MPRQWCWPNRIGRPRRSPADPGCPAEHGSGWRSPMLYRRSRIPRSPVPAMNPAYSCSLICCQRTSSRSYRFFATRSGSMPASIAQSNRFSTTACDCATTPMRQPCSATSRLMTRAAVYVLPVPGGPCTATYDESRSSRAAVMSSTASPLLGRSAPLRVRGRRRNRMSNSAVRGSCGNPAATVAAVDSIESRSGVVEMGGPGARANGI